VVVDLALCGSGGSKSCRPARRQDTPSGGSGKRSTSRKTSSRTGSRP